MPGHTIKGRKLRFRDGDEYDERARRELIAFVVANPCTAVMPGLWVCRSPGRDDYHIRDTGGQYIVTRDPLYQESVPLARIGNRLHNDDAWIRAVLTVKTDSERRG